MKQFFENVFSLRARVANLIHDQAYNSHNKTENYFYGPVYFIGKKPKLKTKINSISSQQIKKQKMLKR